MGCLNSQGKFSHWFGNIHLSGPCNRSCYFCIGQHMLGLDRYNVLDKWPLDGLDEFFDKCRERGVEDVNVTGTNTDPLLFAAIDKLGRRIDREGFRPGIRTNGARARAVGRTRLKSFVNVSISFPSFDPSIYKAMMGGRIIDLRSALNCFGPMAKINIVLSPLLVDLRDTFRRLIEIGVTRVNLREPYGQPHVGDPMPALGYERFGTTLGMPLYNVGGFEGLEVCYWDVHYVEVESVNLYADGTVSETYPITKGYSPSGVVIDQSQWGERHERKFAQWATP